MKVPHQQVGRTGGWTWLATSTGHHQPRWCSSSHTRPRRPPGVSPTRILLPSSSSSPTTASSITWTPTTSMTPSKNMRLPSSASRSSSTTTTTTTSAGPSVVAKSLMMSAARRQAIASSSFSFPTSSSSSSTTSSGGTHPSTPQQQHTVRSSSHSSAHSAESDPTLTVRPYHQPSAETNSLDQNNNHDDHDNNNINNNSNNEKELDRAAMADLFQQYAQLRDGVRTLDYQDVKALLSGVGEHVQDDASVRKMFAVADVNGDGTIALDEFLDHSHALIGDSPARIILVVGGPGSGKGVLSKRLEKECNVVHLSSGALLRDEVAQGTALGRQVRDIMARGELVSSAIMVTLMKKRMRDHPGKRVLLDGFPRSLENAHDLVMFCGQPELALHLVCDDTILMERIMFRGSQAQQQLVEGDVVTTPSPGEERREDDNFQTALQRLRTFHKYHHSTMEWLREQHVPIVNLDCSGSPESVWQQLLAMGRLMRPAVQLPSTPPPLPATGRPAHGG